MTRPEPTGWATANLEQVIEILDSMRVPVNAKERADRQGDVPYYGATGQVGWIDDFLFDEELILLGEDGAPFLDGTKPTAYLIRGKAWVNNHAHVLRAVNPISSPFLMHQLNQVDYHPFVSGTTRLKLPQAPMRKIPLLIAPLPEQTRIVEAIESYFTRLDNAVATLERVQANLKRYRASVLKAAVEGRLVPTEAELARQEDRDYEPASVLLERILKERRCRWEEAALAALKAKGKRPKDDKWKEKYEEPVAPDTSELPELPEGWCWASVESLLRSDGLSYGILKPGDHDPYGVPMVRVLDIGDGCFNDTALSMVTRKLADEYRRTTLEEGNILLAIMATVGRCAIVPPQLVGGNVNRALAVLKLCPFLDPKFVCAAIRSPYFQNVFVKRKLGSAQARINLGDLRTFAFPLPPLSEQSRIVDELSRRESVIQESEAAIELNARRSQRLRQSILKWAFEGKLADQDRNDEPASVLLERIRFEREAKATEPKPKTRKKRNGRKRSAA